MVARSYGMAIDPAGGCGIIGRRPTRPQDGTLFGRGLDAVYRSADLGCLEGVPIRCPILFSRVLTRPGSLGGEGYKKNDGTDACSLSRPP